VHGPSVIGSTNVARVEVVLGIDVGTSSTKGLLVTHSVTEADAEGVRCDEVQAICDILTSTAPGPATLLAPAATVITV
jgi:hypothetical protein